MLHLFLLPNIAFPSTFGTTSYVMVIGYSNRNSVQTGKSDALCYLGIAVASDLILIQQLSKFICSTVKWSPCLFLTRIQEACLSQVSQTPLFRLPWEDPLKLLS